MEGVEVKPVGLRRGALSLVEVLAQSVAGIAPSAGAGLVVAAVALTAGASSWLAWVIGGAALVIISLAIAELAKRFQTTGALYPLASRSGGKSFGYFTAWAAVGANIVGVGAVTLAVGFFVAGYLNLPAFGVPDNSVTFLLCALISLLLAAGAVYWDVRLSAVLMLVIEIFSIGAISVLMFVILGTHPGGVISHQELHLQGINAHAILTATPLVIGAISGFEGAAIFGREAKNPRKAIPISIVGSVAVECVFLVFCSYTMFLGFEGSKLSLTTSNAPLADLAKIAGIGWFGYVVELGVIVSIISSEIALINMASRVFLTLGREHILLPEAVTRVAPKRRTPVGGLVLALACGLVPLVVVVAARFSQLDSFANWSALSGYFLAAMYIVTALAMAWYFARRVRPLSIIRVGIGVLGAVALGYLLYTYYHPLPAFPTSAFLFGFTGVMVLAAVIFAILRGRAPRLLERVGTSALSDTEDADRAVDSRPGETEEPGMEVAT